MPDIQPEISTETALDHAPEFRHEYSSEESATHAQDKKNDDAQRAEIVITIPSDASYVRVVRLAVMGIASRMAFSFEDIEDIKLAVSEACNNAILHARPAEKPSSASSPITVRLFVSDDALEIRVEDDGVVPPPGLMRPAARNPVALGDLPEGGMGLFLIETLMDTVEHQTGHKTVISMTKNVSPSLRSSTAPAHFGDEVSAPHALEKPHNSSAANPNAANSSTL